MSEDLFAAFGQSQTSAPIVAHSTNNDRSISMPTAHEEWPSIDTEDDEFGDFEDASMQTTASPQQKPTQKPPPSVKSSTQQNKKPPPFSPRTDYGPEIGKHPFAGKMDLLFSAGDDDYDAGVDDLDDLANNPEAAMAYSKRIIAEQEQRNAKSAPFAPHSQNSSKAFAGKTVKQHKDPNVLFDIDNPSDDTGEDDWGDFEESGQKSSTTNQTMHPTATKPAYTASNGSASIKHTIQAKPATSQKSNVATVGARLPAKPLLNLSTTDDDEAWDDFDELVPEPVRMTSKPTEQSLSTSSTTSKPMSDHLHTLPPTNIPPPSILLSIFPSIIAAAQSDLFDPLSKLTPAQKQQLIAHPASQQLLLSYIDLGTVLGYIIAGRKLRWKRDQTLAQGMRIGPAAAGGGRGGMKLAGVDKTELAKEEREVLDVVRLWRLHVGKLRSALALAHAHAGGTRRKWPAVPEIALQYPVKTLKQIEGGITAPHPCALCGLRREERVQQQGFEVEDVFHEWWLSGIDMHLRCREFWEKNKRRLQSR